MATIEEKIFDRQQGKLDLSTSVIDEGDSMSNLSKDELADLILPERDDKVFQNHNYQKVQASQLEEDWLAPLCESLVDIITLKQSK